MRLICDVLLMNRIDIVKRYICLRRSFVCHNGSMYSLMEMKVDLFHFARISV